MIHFLIFGCFSLICTSTLLLQILKSQLVPVQTHQQVLPQLPDHQLHLLYNHQPILYNHPRTKGILKFALRRFILINIYFTKCHLIYITHFSDSSVNEKQSKDEHAQNGSNEFAIERSDPNGNESRSNTRARYTLSNSCYSL